MAENCSKNACHAAGDRSYQAGTDKCTDRIKPNRCMKSICNTVSEHIEKKAGKETDNYVWSKFYMCTFMSHRSLFFLNKVYRYNEK